MIGVRISRAAKILWCDAPDETIQINDKVIIETPAGLEIGKAVKISPEIEKNPSAKIHRKATAADITRETLNHVAESEAHKTCRQKINELNLPMKLIRVHYLFDVSKIIFYFTADGRVDFRELVRALARIYRTRIELRQVGVREDAKECGGIGVCGRELCCATCLCDFAQVTVRMAKEQNLSLNPAKISGQCGRLLCCLKFENDYYHALADVEDYQPERGDRVQFSDGQGRVLTVKGDRSVIKLDNKRIVEVDNTELILLNS